MCVYVCVSAWLCVCACVYNSMLVDLEDILQKLFFSPSTTRGPEIKLRL